MKLPETAGGWRCIYADPAWRFRTRGSKDGGRSPDSAIERDGEIEHRHYATMTLGGMMRLPIDAIAANDCALFMWAVDPMLEEAINLGAAWGFQLKTIAFYWAKTKDLTFPHELETADHLTRSFHMGMGYWTRANPELCLLFTRGKPRRLSAGVRRLVIAPRQEHSRKPTQIRTAIEKLVPGPRLELFARSEAPGWTAWGNETTKFSAD